MIKRWPIILTGIVDTIHGACHALALEVNDLAAEDPRQEAVKTQIEEGKELIEKISKLKYEMARDRALEYVDCSFPVRSFMLVGLCRTTENQEPRYTTSN